MSRTQVILVSGCCLLVGLGFGALIGHFATKKSGNVEDQLVDSSSKMNQKDNFTDKIIQSMNAEKISENLRYLSENPHMAGTKENFDLADEIEKRWKSYNFDIVKQVSYNVLLSQPNRDQPNKVHILSSSGEILYSSAHKEEPMRNGDDHPNFVHAFHGYSPNGSVEGELVYVNYATKKDFDELESLGISVEGKIVLAKYGKIFRGNKVALAEKRKAKGVILFTDPAEVAPLGTDPSQVYPNSQWLPGTGIQRGTVASVEGDPLTPGYPAIDGVYRQPFRSIPLPKIISQPIGYKDAYELLRLMNGPEAPKHWQGGLNITYKIGPGFSDGGRVRLNVHNNYKFDETIKNVIGIIKGSVEPDRYVLLGNHRDAWGFGAIDPSSGTAQLLEVSRVYGELLKTGWRPHRTIAFCSWGGEEFAIIGSIEWVEEHIHKLLNRAVSYINVDICTSGPIFEPTASPILKEALLHVIRQVPDTQDSSMTIYDAWKDHHHRLKKTTEDPDLNTLGSGSDHAPFTFFAGIPSIDITFAHDKLKYNVSMYAAYHTGYETYYMVDKFIDPGFKNHQGCARISGLLLKYLADSLILPFDVRNLARKMKSVYDEFKQKSEELLKNFGISLDKLGATVKEFGEAAENWIMRTAKINKNSVLETRIINDQIVKMEQTFILREGFPGRPFFRHALFAPSKYDSYSSSGFPVLYDLVYEAMKTNSTDEWKKVKRHVSDLVVIIHQAKAFLDPVYDI